MPHSFLRSIAMLSVLILALMACSQDAEDTNMEGAERERLASTAVANYNPDAPFTFEVQAPGGQTLNFSDTGLFRCFDPLESIAIDSARGIAPAIVSFEIPSDTEPGTYEVYGSEDRLQGDSREAFTVFVRVDVGDIPGTGNYYENISGELMIEQLAESPQERVAGQFDITVSTDDGDLLVSGEFDFLSPTNESFFCTGATGFFGGQELTPEPDVTLEATAEADATPALDDTDD